MTSRPSSFATNDGESCVCMCFLPVLVVLCTIL
jgi:hypothetical protein